MEEGSSFVLSFRGLSLPGIRFTCGFRCSKDSESQEEANAFHSTAGSRGEEEGKGIGPLPRTNLPQTEGSIP